MNDNNQLLAGLTAGQQYRIGNAMAVIASAKLANATELDLSRMELNSQDLRLLMPTISGIIGLERLDLSHNNLDSLPETIAQLSSLKKLYLNNNKITAISREIGNLKGLVRLDLHFNRLRSIPSEIGALTKLEILVLWKNLITEIPSTIGALKRLKYLNVNSNQLQTIPREIENLSRLEKLHLDDNKLIIVPATLGDLAKLRVLSLKDNDTLQVLPETITRLSPTLDLSLDLTLLSKRLSDKLMKHFKVFESQKTKYQILAGLSGERRARIAAILNQIERAVQHNSPELDMSNRQLTKEDLELLIPALQNVPSLERLNLRSNVLRTLPATITNLSSVKKLDLSQNGLTEIPECIGAWTQLEHLGLHDNQLSSIPEGIGNLTNLKSLNIEGNHALDTLPKGMTRLSTALDLDIDMNRMSQDTSNMLEDYFNIFVPNRMEFADRHPYVPAALKKIYPEMNSHNLWEQIAQTDLGIFEPGGFKGEYYSTYKVLKKFILNFPIQDPFAQDIYIPIARALLDEILSLEVSDEKRKEALQKLAMSLGDCATPVKNFLIQLLMGKCNGKRTEDIPKEARALMMATAVGQHIQTTLKDCIHEGDSAEHVAALLHVLFLRDQPEWRRTNPIPIAGLEGYPTLPKFSTNVDFGFQRLTDRIKQRFTRLYCKTDTKGNPEILRGKYQADCAKINAIVDTFFAQHGIFTLRERALQTLTKTLKALTQRYPDLATLYYDKPGVDELINLQVQLKNFRKELHSVQDNQVDRMLMAKLTSVRKSFEQLNDRYKQEKDFHTLTTPVPRLMPAPTAPPESESETRGVHGRKSQSDRQGKRGLR